MTPDAETERRREAARRTARDLDRLRARPEDDGFWPALRVLGSIGWPVALMTLLGAGVGWAVGIPWLTAALIVGGAGVGAWVALSGLRSEAP